MTGLDIRNLSVTLSRDGESFRAVDGISLHISPGETLALVGESGSGKSVTALAVMRLLPTRNARAEADAVSLDGLDLPGLSESDMRRVRGDRISMVFQEPMTSLNPVLTVGEQIVEVLSAHRSLSRAEARRQAVDLCRMVRIPDAESKVDAFPHQLSGGMRQRVVIAIALACRPEILIADEPTTALDTTIQAQVLRLMRELQREVGTGILLITHNLGVVAQMADRVAVLYAGRVVEQAGVRELFARPRHPYTRGLMRAMPRPGAFGRLAELPGGVPDPLHRPTGCVFHDRCDQVAARCAAERPDLTEAANGHAVACFAPERAAP